MLENIDICLDPITKVPDISPLRLCTLKEAPFLITKTLQSKKGIVELVEHLLIEDEEAFG